MGESSEAASPDAEAAHQICRFSREPGARRWGMDG